MESRTRSMTNTIANSPENNQQNKNNQALQNPTNDNISNFILFFHLKIINSFKIHLI